MDKRLFSAGHLAIPLQSNENSTLSPQPNFLVIDRMEGRTKAELPVLGDTVCAFSRYKIVYREILPASVELSRAEEMREVIYEQANQPVPASIYEALSDHSALLAGVANVNFMLGLFSFRGALEGLQLVIDEVALQDIINSL